MPVTKQTYSLAAGWTYSALAGLFRSAFIDAGLMTEWYDSFVNSTIENRVLEVVYDATKTYGKCYYWFQFYANDVRYGLASGWSTATDAPTGTQFVDFFNNSTNTPSNNSSIMTYTPSTSSIIEVIRYTSQANSTHSWFLVRQGGNASFFFIAHPSHAPASWLDLNKNMFHHLMMATLSTSGSVGRVTFHSRGLLRRSAIGGAAGAGSSSNQQGGWLNTAAYFAVGRTSNNFANNMDTSVYSSINLTHVGIPLPSNTSSANPAYSTDYNPIVYGLPYSFYMTNSNLPSDLAIIPHYANNTMARFDTFVVTAGVEEWEIVLVSNNATGGTGASVALAARVI